MKSNHLPDFGRTAIGLSRNPLGIIALFIVLVYGLACLVLITRALQPIERLPLIYFLVIFPVVVIGVFTYLVVTGKVFAPYDFPGGDQNFIEFYRLLALQRGRASAIASLAVAKRSSNTDVNIAEITRTVDRVENLRQLGTENPSILWVDDNPGNNALVKQAFEAVMIRVVLSETTSDALDILSRQRFDAVISDMARREGPREGYVLLDALRGRGDKTPLFFYAGSAAPEHIRETREHGGQGCTNDGQELFEMVTAAIFGRGFG